MNNWKVIFATVVIFGAGVVMGGLLVNYVQHSHSKIIRHTAEVHPPATNPAPRQVETPKPQRPPEILSRSFLQQLTEVLHLKPDQHETIEKIINDGQNQMRKAIQDARLEIREVLTTEQRKQFDEVMKRPFHKTIFATNSTAAADNDFKARLEKIVAAQRATGGETVPAPPVDPATNATLSVEAQNKLVDEQISRFLSAMRDLSFPPPPQETNTVQ